MRQIKNKDSSPAVARPEIKIYLSLSLSWGQGREIPNLIILQDLKQPAGGILSVRPHAAKWIEGADGWIPARNKAG